MENGVEALKIAFGVLVFVLAITITISVFTTATQALNRVFNIRTEEEYVKGPDGNYLNFVKFDGGTREVGVETIIPSIYRAYKENYAIYFYNKDGNELFLYEKENGEKVNYFDLEKEIHTSAEGAVEKVNKLLYEESSLYPNGLYEELKGKAFIEKLGEYYMNDVINESEIAEVNKTKKRVIVYQLTDDSI